MPIAGLLLALSLGCSSDATSPEVSAALARTIHERLEVQATEPDHGGVPGWSSWQADLFMVGLEGIDDDLEMSDPLRGVIEAYWDDNEVIEVPAELSLAEQGPLLAAHHTETAERFEAYASALQEMAAEDKKETAARGLLAVAVMLHVSSARSLYYQYPRLDLLDRVILANQYSLTPPSCPLFQPHAKTPGSLMDCGLPSGQRWDAEVGIVREVMAWLDEIEDEEEQSPWRETVMAARYGEDIRIKPSFALSLPESTSRIDPEVAVNVVISTRSISVDGVDAVRYAGAVPAGKGKVGHQWSALQNQLNAGAVDAKKLAAKNSTKPTGLWLLQCDVSAPLSLVYDVMEAAAHEGFTRPQIVVFPATPSPLLRYTSIHVVPLTYVEALGRAEQAVAGAANPPGVPVLAIGQDGFELRAPRPASIQSETGDSWPYAILTREMVTLRDELGDGKTIAIAADPSIGFETLVATMDAVREHGCDEAGGCQELFPEILLLAAPSP